MSQDAYTHQIIVEKNQVGAVPSVQQLLEMSLVSSDLKFEEVCSFLRAYCKLDFYYITVCIPSRDIL